MRASDKDFDLIRKHFPFSCVDLFIVTPKGYILTKRKGKPYNGSWHLPGGVIHKGQTLREKANEVAKRELNCKIRLIELVGVFENLNRYRHDISHCFLAELVDDDYEPPAKLNIGFFRKNPANMIPYHKKIVNYSLERYRNLVR